MDSAGPFIFPTLSRAKHSHLVSYPIGAEALSRALDGVPQHGVITCDFYAGNAHQHLDKPNQLVLSVLYRKTARTHFHGQDAASRGVFDPRWMITVFAVDRALRHAVKTRLIEQGLPHMLRPWLIENAAVTGKTGECGLTVHYDLASGALTQSVRTALLPERS